MCRFLQRSVAMKKIWSSEWREVGMMIGAGESCVVMKSVDDEEFVLLLPVDREG